MTCLRSWEDPKEGKELELQDYPVLQEVVFQELTWIPRDREIDFIIDLVPGVVPSSKAPYRMSTL